MIKELMLEMIEGYTLPKLAEDEIDELAEEVYRELVPFIYEVFAEIFEV